MNIADLEIGASEAAAPLGLSSYETPLAFYARKLRVADPREETEAMRLGTMLEPTLARMFEQEFDVPLRKAETLYDPRVSWLRSTEDYYFRAEDAPAKLRETMQLDDGEHVIVELKTAGLASAFMRERIEEAWGEAGGDHIPAEYATQVQTQIMVRNAVLDFFGDGFCTRAFVKTLIAGRGSPTFRVIGNREVHSFILGELSRFVEQHIVPEFPPDPVDLADWGLVEEMVRRPQKSRALRKASEQEMRIIAGWRFARAAREQAELLEANARTGVIQAIGHDYGFDLGEWGHVVYTAGKEVPKTSKAAAFDAIMALVEKRDHPLAEQIRAIRDIHTKPGWTGRQLRPTWRDQGTKK